MKAKTLILMALCLMACSRMTVYETSSAGDKLARKTSFAAADTVVRVEVNTKAEKPSFTGSIRPSSDMRGSGGVVIFKKCSRKVSTPKLVSAEPKNTGLSSP